MVAKTSPVMPTGRFPRTAQQVQELLPEAAKPKLTRFLVRRPTGEVFIWRERIALRGDLEEVFAESAAAALGKQTIPDLRNITREDIEGMKLETLVLFAGHKLGKELDPSLPLAELKDQIIAAVVAATGRIRG